MINKIGPARFSSLALLSLALVSQQGKAGDGNGAGPILIDVREKDEWSEGFIPGARWISRGFLEQRIEDQVPQRSSPSSASPSRHDRQVKSQTTVM